MNTINGARMRAVLLATTSLSLLFAVAPAVAQQTPAPPEQGGPIPPSNTPAGPPAAVTQPSARPPAAQQRSATPQTESGRQASANQATDSNVLGEVVVTATRQVGTVNKVPLSVTAETQKMLDQQGIKNITDLQATVPALQVTTQNGPGVANIAIRGILQGSQGAATTGFFLDDTPIQKRNVGGGVATSNGTPLPPLFDLERVEVLRGPQGTLFGGASEGGTIRYITPTPSLTKYSTYLRGEVSGVDGGGLQGEAGAAVGGPIIQDKIGFRASYFQRHSSGWIDTVNPYTGKVTHEDANDDDTRVFRGSVLFAPTEASRITLSILDSYDRSKSASQNYGLSTTSSIVVPTECYNTTALTPATRLNPPPVAVGGANCAAATAAGKANFTRPGATYGPYTLGKNQVLDIAGLTPARTNILIPTATFEYNWPTMSVKSITSYIDDETKSITLDQSQITNTRLNATYGSQSLPQGLPLLAQYPDFGAGNGHFFSFNKRYGISQEVRFSSTPDSRPFTWVAGVFYSYIKSHAGYQIYYDLDRVAGTLYGTDTQTRYGVPPLASPTGTLNVFDTKDQELADEEIAAFGELNFYVTDKLRLTAGVRQSRVSFNYQQLFYGPVNSNNTPTVENGLKSSGSVSESPVTPKFGVNYQFTTNNLAYFTASKGFRPGGVNARLSPNICGPSLSQYGLTTDDVPTTYSSDSVWSYELGSKVRVLNNRVQINADIYRIDWDNVQTTQSPGFGCGIVFTANAGSATSQGVELESQARIIQGLNANLAFSYNDAKYNQNAVAIAGKNGGRNLVVALEDQTFPVPAFSVNFGLRYDRPMFDKNFYVRGDFRYQAPYTQAPYPVGSYSPDTYYVPAANLVNLRAGVEIGDLDINIFANNLFNYDRGIRTGGRAGCASQACTTYSTYNPFVTENGGTPRVIGLQIAYRH